MSFSAEAWQRIGPLYEAILALPFNQELAAGTLSRERFTFYILQDALYPTQFGRALAVTAARAPDEEALIQFLTEPKNESGADDLFGDDSAARIALVGTSHSGKNYNFGGFLEQHLGTEVLNAAFPGGGLEGAMVEYLGSEAFQNNPPKIIIWEFSPLYDLASDKVHRQLMATLNNGCSGQEARLSATTRLKPGSNEILVNGENSLLTLPGNRHQIDLRFSDPSIKRLDATLWYLNGRREQIKLEKPDTIDTDGRFAFELRDEPGWGEQNFFALEILKPEDSSPDLEVEASLCQRPSGAQQVAQRAAQD